METARAPYTFQRVLTIKDPEQVAKDFRGHDDADVLIIIAHLLQDTPP